MADELQKPSSPPAGASAAGPEPEIHVIPEKFYGAALKQRVGKAPATPPPPTAPPVPPAPGAKPVKKGGKGPLIGALVVVVLLVGGGLAAWFLFLRPQQPPVNTPPVNTAPPGPRCGDATCDPNENPATCSADCQPAAPECGNGTCDAPTETTSSCAADCPAPAPVCGDNACAAPEENVESCPADCRPPEPDPGVDTDSDGLTDEEERNVFGTRIDDPNSDRDSYVDLNEALNLFDPAKTPPALLADNPGFALYRNVELNAELLRPAAWTVGPGAGGAATVFTAQSGESFTVSVVTDRIDGQSFIDWYLAREPAITRAQVEPFTTRQGYEAIVSLDRLTTYVDVGGRIFILTYDLGPRTEVQYKITFQVMAQSLRLIQ